MDIEKFIAGKMRIAQDGKPSANQPGQARVPPGQKVVERLPILDLGIHPDIDLRDYRLVVDGCVEQPLSLDWPALQALGVVDLPSDFHCVTRWSRLDTGWRGVPTRELLRLAKPRSEASHVMAHSADGYSTNLPLDYLQADNALVATGLDGEPLPVKHGGPARLVIPALYAWKSAKWLTRLEILSADQRGFWEQRGYHNHADPWLEQRYSWQESASDEAESVNVLAKRDLDEV